MAWDFSTDPEYAEQLEWVRTFVREECEPLDLVIEESHDLNDPVRQALIPPLQAGRQGARACGRPTSGRISAGRATGR